MSAILYINDNNLILRHTQGVARSQGYAWLKDKDVYFDTHSENNAVQHCRLAPQQSNNRYWQQCDQSSIAANETGMRHSADLIWRHLSELKNNFDLSDLTLVVPSHYQPDNLELLVGVVQAAGMSVKGIVNLAVLALHDKVETEGVYQHVDVQLHQTVCSSVTVAKGVASLTHVDVLHDVSIQAIQDALLKIMQHSFIQNDRFDPLHYAETEQQLFDQIPAAAKKIAQESKTSLLVEYASRLHSVTLDDKRWNKALEQYMRRLLQIIDNNSGSPKSQQAFIQLNRLFENIVPNQLLIEGLSVISDDDLPVIHSTALSDELVYTNQLSIRAQIDNVKEPQIDTVTDISEDEQSQTVATHLLQAGVAVPLQHVYVTTSDNQLKLSNKSTSNVQALLDIGELFVLGDPDRKMMLPNDRLGSHIADGVLTVIQVT